MMNGHCGMAGVEDLDLFIENAETELVRFRSSKRKPHDKSG